AILNFASHAPPLHWDGTAWTAPAMLQANEQFSVLFAAVAPVRSDLVWFAGYDVSGGKKALIVRRWDGKVLTEVFRRGIPYGEHVFLEDLWSDGDKNVWVSGYPTLRWDGSVWHEIDVTTRGVWALQSRDVWLLVDSNGVPGAAVQHWDGASLTMAI